MKELKLPLEQPYHELVLNFLNQSFGNSQASIEFWKEEVTPKLQIKFDVNWKEPTTLRNTLTNFKVDEFNGLALVFSKLKTATGLIFSQRFKVNGTKDQISYFS